jgi:hypothetical protein
MVPKVKRFREWLLAEMESALAQLDGVPGGADVPPPLQYRTA